MEQMYTNENHLDKAKRTGNQDNHHPRVINGERTRSRSRSSTISVKRKIPKSPRRDNQDTHSHSDSRKYYKFRDPYEKEFLRQSHKYNTDRDDRRDRRGKDSYRNHHKRDSYEKRTRQDTNHRKNENGLNHRRQETRDYRSIEKSGIKRDSPSRNRSKRRDSTSRERSRRRHEKSRERSKVRGSRSRDRSRRYRSRSRHSSRSRNKINRRSKSNDKPISNEEGEVDFAALRRKNRRTTKSNSAMRVMKVNLFNLDEKY